MAYITRHGTMVLHPRAVRAAIVEEAYHSDTEEYFVLKRFAVRGEQFAEGGDTIMARPTERWPDRAWVTNLTYGISAIVDYETFAHNVRPKELTVR